MQGYVVRKGAQLYAVIYEGLDPLTGRERRRSHTAGTDRAEAEQLASKLAAGWMPTCGTGHHAERVSRWPSTSRNDGSR